MVADFLGEAAAADDQRAGMAQHRQHRLLVGLAAGADPVAVASLDRDDVGDAETAADFQGGQPAGIAVLGVDEVEGLDRVLGLRRFDHGRQVGFEIGGAVVAHFLLSQRFQADDLDAGHGGRRAAAIDGGACGVVAVLRDHDDVVTARHQLAQQVGGIDAHAGDGGEEAAADEADTHGVTHSGGSGLRLRRRADGP